MFLVLEILCELACQEPTQSSWLMVGGQSRRSRSRRGLTSVASVLASGPGRRWLCTLVAWRRLAAGVLLQVARAVAGYDRSPRLACYAAGLALVPGGAQQQLEDLDGNA